MTDDGGQKPLVPRTEDRGQTMEDREIFKNLH